MNNQSEFPNWARDKEIAEAIIQGATGESVGKKYDLTPPRGLQITIKVVARLWGCASKNHRLNVSMIRENFKHYPLNWASFYSMSNPSV